MSQLKKVHLSGTVLKQANDVTLQTFVPNLKRTPITEKAEILYHYL